MDVSEPAVAVVVPCWNHEDETLRCLDALDAINYRNRRLIFVDNASEADGFARLLRGAAHVELVRFDRNRGFSAAVNEGIRRALQYGVDYVWILNSDAVVDADSLSALIALAESEPTLGAVGSVLDEGDALVYGANVSLWNGYSAHVRAADAPRPDYLIGASVLVRSRSLRDVGGFDEGYFLYWEDADFSFWLRNAGWGLAVAAASKVTHRGRGALAFCDPMRDFHYTRSSVRFLGRHARWPRSAATILTARRFASRLRYRRWANAGAILRALVPVGDGPSEEIEGR